MQRSNLKTLFVREICKSGKTTKIEALAGRAGAFKPRKLHIETISETTLDTKNIQLINVICVGDCQIGSLGETSSVSTSYFNEIRDVNFKVFGACRKMGLIFEFYNPTNEDVIVYITILGDAAVTDLIGKA